MEPPVAPSGFPPFPDLLLSPLSQVSLKGKVTTFIGISSVLGRKSVVSGDSRIYSTDPSVTLHPRPLSLVQRVEERLTRKMTKYLSPSDIGVPLCVCDTPTTTSCITN